MIEPPPQGALAWPGTVGGSWPRAKIQESESNVGKKTCGKNPMGRIRIVEELFIVWEYCVPTKMCVTFCCFSNGKEVKKSKQHFK